VAFVLQFGFSNDLTHFVSEFVQLRTLHATEAVISG